MVITVKNEAPFQILTGAFTIGPSPTGYELQVGATPQSFTTLFSVGANTPRMVTNVANGSYFRMKNNVGDVEVNWQRTCAGGGGGGGADYTPGEYIDIQNNVISVTGITPDQYLTTADTQNFVTSGDVATQISAATQGFATEAYVTAATANLMTSSATQTMINAATSGITEELSDLEDMMETKEEVVASALTELDARIIEISGNTPDLTNYYTKAETDAEITAATQGFATEAYVTAATSPIQTQLDDVERVTATALTELHQDILDLSGSTSEFVTSGNVATQISAATQGLATEEEISAITSMMETKEEVIAAALVDLNDNKVGSTSISTIVTLTQAEYDALTVKDPTTFYIIKNN